jgi:hypothetical protein
METVIGLSFLFGAGIGIVCGPLLYLVFKKDFWKVLGAFYRKVTGDIKFLENEVKKWKELCENTAWYKDLEKYKEKLAVVQQKEVGFAKQKQDLDTKHDRIKRDHNILKTFHDQLHDRAEWLWLEREWMNREYE